MLINTIISSLQTNVSLTIKLKIFGTRAQKQFIRRKRKSYKIGAQEKNKPKPQKTSALTKSEIFLKYEIIKTGGSWSN